MNIEPSQDIVYMTVVDSDGVHHTIPIRVWEIRKNGNGLEGFAFVIATVLPCTSPLQEGLRAIPEDSVDADFLDNLCEQSPKVITFAAALPEIPAEDS